MRVVDNHSRSSSATPKISAACTNTSFSTSMTGSGDASMPTVQSSNREKLLGLHQLVRDPHAFGQGQRSHHQAAGK